MHQKLWAFFFLQISAALNGSMTSSSFSLVDSSAIFNVGDTLRVMSTGSQQLLMANRSLLQINALSAAGGIKMQRLTTHLVCDHKIAA